jgi:[NiFe] hydrogenase diaphorase moiety large subunit
VTIQPEEKTTVSDICQELGTDRTRLLDVVRAVQQRCGRVDPEAIDQIAGDLGLPRVEVESVVSFYSFLSPESGGRVTIRLCNDVIDRFAGVDRVAEVLSRELSIGFGETTTDGDFGLQWTPCIGMSDQAPAALINDVVLTELSTDSAREIVRGLKAHGDPKKLVRKLGDGNNAHPLVRAAVKNHLRLNGPVIFSELEAGEALAKTIALSPAEVIRSIKTARLRGRGGAGFPTGMKWEFTRATEGAVKYVICNADEGEPGTFKDRVILTERPDLIFEGMAIAGYAIGAEHGILYLRAEYQYLRRFLEDVLEKRRRAGFLGRDICGKKNLHFDIHIQMGAGSYVCGEETALISSCEGQRGDPKTRPPFPAQKGFLGYPTIVNNVETFCCAARIMEKGAGWFSQLGTKGSTGTKLLSISGDCLSPGVYEFPFGVRLSEVLKIAGANDVAAVQVGGAAGRMVAEGDFERTICFDDLSTGGSLMIFDRERNVVEIVRQFLDFFVHESCGYCTPCRVGNVLLKERLDRILAGTGESTDLDYLKELGETIKATSRCGLGQTSPNPVLSSLTSFRDTYERLVGAEQERKPHFSIHRALEESAAIAGRRSVVFPDEGEQA